MVTGQESGPAPVVPVPASTVIDLRGRRVVVGEPGTGWRYDLRSDAPHGHGTDDEPSHVPVLAELDFYRAERDRVEVFAPLVPIDQVWVEQVATNGPVWPGAVDPAAGPVRGLTAPPVRRPTPVADAGHLTGRRLVLHDTGTTRRDLRAASDAYRDDRGQLCVNVCPEADWYAWAVTGRSPVCQSYPVDLLWLE